VQKQLAEEEKAKKAAEEEKKKAEEEATKAKTEQVQTALVFCGAGGSACACCGCRGGWWLEHHPARPRCAGRERYCRGRLRFWAALLAAFVCLAWGRLAARPGTLLADNAAPFLPSITSHRASLAHSATHSFACLLCTDATRAPPCLAPHPAQAQKVASLIFDQPFLKPYAEKLAPVRAAVEANPLLLASPLLLLLPLVLSLRGKKKKVGAGQRPVRAAELGGWEEKGLLALVPCSQGSASMACCHPSHCCCGRHPAFLLVWSCSKGCPHMHMHMPTTSLRAHSGG
jgi:hypothetical protein